MLGDRDGEGYRNIVQETSQVDSPSTREHSARLFFEMGRAEPPRQQHFRHALITLHLPLVEHCARRFANRGETLDDLVQVGSIGLIKAIDRFEPERGVEFSTYATPTIIGEIKRHFRDKAWAVRVPRRLQELRGQLNEANQELSQQLGRSPTAREVAERLGTSVEEVLEVMESSNVYHTISLDHGGQEDDAAPGALHTLGERDDALEAVELRESLRPALNSLPERERNIVLLRFIKGMSQTQIAEEIGISQMHVSRLLSRTLTALRASMES